MLVQYIHHQCGRASFLLSRQHQQQSGINCCWCCLERRDDPARCSSRSTAPETADSSCTDFTRRPARVRSQGGRNPANMLDDHEQEQNCMFLLFVVYATGHDFQLCFCFPQTAAAPRRPTVVRKITIRPVPRCRRIIIRSVPRCRRVPARPGPRTRAARGTAPHAPPPPPPPTRRRTTIRIRRRRRSTVRSRRHPILC